MPLKLPTIKLREILFLKAYTYRVPLPVRNVRVFENGYAYPICPRCRYTLDREYMSFCDRCGQKLDWRFLKFR